MLRCAEWYKTSSVGTRKETQPAVPDQIANTRTESRSYMNGPMVVLKRCIMPWPSLSTALKSQTMKICHIKGGGMSFLWFFLSVYQYMECHLLRNADPLDTAFIFCESLKQTK